MTRGRQTSANPTGEPVIIAVWLILMAALVVGIIVAKVNAEIVGGCVSASNALASRQVAGQPPALIVASAGRDLVRFARSRPGSRPVGRRRTESGPAGTKLGLGRVPSACGQEGLYPGGSAYGETSLRGLHVENRTGRALRRGSGRAATTGESRVQSGHSEKSEKPAQARLVRLFDAIRQVESAGNDYAVGDGGRSKGPYQCGRAAWADGGGNPEDYDRLVWDRAACERVMLGYWKRYGAVTDEQKARTWNGGPRGMQKKATLAYWRKVKGELR